MRGDAEILETVARHAITGSGAHVETGRVFSGVDWKAAGLRPDGAPHSLYQLLNHTMFWQEWVLKWLEGTTPRVPKHASGSWRGGVAPATRTDWERAVRRFQRGLAQLERHTREGDLLSTRGQKSRLEMLLTIGAHTSHHAGQAVLLRQVLGQWPPPGGGVTW